MFKIAKNWSGMYTNVCFPCRRGGQVGVGLPSKFLAPSQPKFKVIILNQHSLLIHASNDKVCYSCIQFVSDPRPYVVLNVKFH